MIEPGNYFRLLIILSLLLSLGHSLLLADKHIVEKVSVQSDPGSEKVGSPVRIETWLGTDRISRIDNLRGFTTIVRRDINKMYIIRHSAKEAVEIDIPFEMPADYSSLFGEVKMTWGVITRSESRDIGKWRCKKVELHGRGTIKVDMQMWVTPESGVDVGTLYTLLEEALELSPFFRDLGIQFLGLHPDFSVHSITTVDRKGISSTVVAEVESIVDEPAPRGTYDIPKDFKTRQFNFSSYLTIVRGQYTPIPSLPR